MTSERAKAICPFLLQCFSGMRDPNTIKMDNGPAYTSKKINIFVKSDKSSILQVYLITLKNKLLLNVCIGLLKPNYSKTKRE